MPILRGADDGTLYGGTAQGGKYGNGTIFKLTSPEPGETKWREKVLADIAPAGRLLLGPDGTLYGAAADSSTIFSLTPPVPGTNGWKLQLLYTFAGGADGHRPIGDLIMDDFGALYGVNIQGGIDDGGTVFKLMPPEPGAITWREEVLYRFRGPPDALLPGAGLVMDNDGTLYGTTYFGGEFNEGAVFSLTPPIPGETKWKEKVIYSFTGQPDGVEPGGRLTIAAGVLYGTTCLGGKYGKGKVFSLTPPAPGKHKWTETVLHSFNVADGECPAAALTTDSNGVFYGTTAGGGKSDVGTVFKLVP